MRILLLGATGRTGKMVLEFAIKQGYEVSCLVRSSKNLKDREGIKIFEGNAINPVDLKEAAAGCECVVSALNISRTSDFPWSKLKTPKKYLSDVTRNVISLAGKMNIQRIIICSAWGVAETKNDIPWWFKWFIENSNIGIAYLDHERQEKLLEQSDLDWTIVRPTGLTNTKSAQKIRESFNITQKLRLTISRKSVAKYMIESLTNDKLIGKKVSISQD